MGNVAVSVEVPPSIERGSVLDFKNLAGVVPPQEVIGNPWLVDEGFTTHEAQIHLDLPYLVKDLFDRGQIIVLWGAPGSGKTFCALSLATHIGAGQRWAGRRVKAGTVLYLCAESTRKRLENRVKALIGRYPELEDSRVLFVPTTLDLLQNEQDIADLIASAKQLEDVALIVIDTLAVTFGGGNENAPEDMGAYVANLKRIKAETGAAVLVVHHSGKDEAKGMRGHSALLGALDAEMSVERIEAPEGMPNRILKAGKLREGNSYSDLFAFSLEVVSLGVDPDGDLVTTCVVVPAEGARITRPPATAAQVKLLRALEDSYRAGEVVWTEKAIRELARGYMHRNSISSCVIGLCNAGYLRPSVGGYILVNPPERCP